MVAKKAKKTVIKTLTISLTDPGMTPMHRAGLAGLAATLDRIGRGLKQGTARISARSVTLEWDAESPQDFFQEILEKGLKIDDASHIIDFPALRDRLGSSASLEARLLSQEALTGTFLQHGQSRKLDSARELVLDPDSAAKPRNYRPLLKFNHQEQAAELAKAFLKDKSVPIAGWALPGATERHPGSKWSRMEEPCGSFLALCFAPVGCFSFKVRHHIRGERQGYALVIPTVTDLIAYQKVRRQLNTLGATQLIVASADDAAMTLALASHRKLTAQRLCEVMAFGTQPWAKQQKTRTHVSVVRRPDPITLSLYAHAASIPEFATRQLRSKKGDAFYVTSPSRGAIAEALVQGQDWWEGIANAYIQAEPGARKRFEQPFERRGLIIMSTHPNAFQDRERFLVDALHNAMSQLYASIGQRTKEAGTDFSRKVEVELTKARASLLHAKTAQSSQDAIFAFLARASRSKIRSNTVLKARRTVRDAPDDAGEELAGWQAILPLFEESRWRSTRNLALLALLSYPGRQPDDEAETPDGTDTDTGADAPEAEAEG